MEFYKGTSNLYRNYVASNLRSQLATLKNIIEHVEATEIIDEDYFDFSLRQVSTGLRRLRKKTNI
jgi:hypothetical protein